MNTLELRNASFTQSDDYMIELSATAEGCQIYLENVQSAGDTLAFIGVAGTGCSVVANGLNSWQTAPWLITDTGSFVYSVNHGGIEGYWRSGSNTGFIESSAVTRTGGGAFSLYCERSGPDMENSNFPHIGRRGRNELIWCNVPAGTHEIRIYGAYELFAAPLTPAQIIMELEYSDANGALRRVNSYAKGAFPTDSSVWSAATITPFYMSVNITVPTDQIVPVRIRGYYPNAGGASVFIDPEPVFVV